MAKMLYRDGPFQLNIKDTIAYCQTVENKICRRFTTVIDPEEYIGKYVQKTLKFNDQ